MADLTQQSLRGIRWSAVSQLAAQLAQYGSFILLARLLTPGDFGLLALATFAVGLVAMLNELGLAAALIQRAEPTQRHLNAAFWINAGVSLVLWLGLSLGAGLVAHFFHQAELAPLLVALAASFPLVGLGVVPKALLEKQLRFKLLGAIDATSAFVNGAVAIALALAGCGVWSFVVATLAGYLVQLAALWAAQNVAIGWRFGRDEARELLGFGLNVLGTRWLSYLSANIGTLVIGRLLGPAAVGAYSLAYKLVTWPMLRISHVVLRVVYPAFSRIQHDDAALRERYAQLTGTLALVTFPLLAGLGVLAPELVPGVFGAQWTSAVLLTQLLCVAGMFKAMVCSIGVVFLTKGRPELEFRLNVLGTLKLAAFVAVGSRWGVDGVAVAVLASTLVGAPMQQHFANRLVGLSWRRYAEALATPALATAALALALGAWRGLASVQHWPLAVLLAGAVPLALVSYGFALRLGGIQPVSLVRQLIGQPRRGASKAA